MKKNFITSLFISILTIFFCFNFFIVSAGAAQNLNDAFGSNSPLDKAAGGAGYDPTKYEVQPIIGAVIKTFLSILGIIFLILMIYSGYAWMTAHGDEQKVTKAKETITAAIIGLVIVLGAYAITFFVISKLTASTLQ